MLNQELPPVLLVDIMLKYCLVSYRHQRINGTGQADRRHVTHNRKDRREVITHFHEQ